MKNRISIGISSFILIFLVLSLSVFCLLSLSSAKSALTYAEKYADAVKHYYDTDAIGQTFIRDYRDMYARTSDVPTVISALEHSLPLGSQLLYDTNHLVTCDIPLNTVQALHIEIAPSGENISSYYVYNCEDYVIDTDLPVWTGN